MINSEGSRRIFLMSVRIIANIVLIFKHVGYAYCQLKGLLYLPLPHFQGQEIACKNAQGQIK